MGSVLGEHRHRVCVLKRLSAIGLDDCTQASASHECWRLACLLVLAVLVLGVSGGLSEVEHTVDRLPAPIWSLGN